LTAPHMPRIPRLTAPQRKRQVLDAALACFALGGYRGTTTAQIAEAAGVTEPILYRHFPAKLDLFVNAIDAAGARVVESWREAVDRGGDLLAGPGPRAAAATRVLLAGFAEAPRERRVRSACERQMRGLRSWLAGPAGPQLAELVASAWLGSALSGAGGAPAALRPLLPPG